MPQINFPLADRLSESTCSLMDTELSKYLLVVIYCSFVTGKCSYIHGLEIVLFLVEIQKPYVNTTFRGKLARYSTRKLNLYWLIRTSGGRAAGVTADPIPPKI